MLLQVLSGVALLLGYRAWRFRMRGSTSLWRPLLAKLVLVDLFALTSLLLPKLGLQGGVLALFSQLTAIWTALAALRVLLVHFLPAEEVDAYWQRVMLSLLKLFDQNLANLLLPLGLPYFLVVLSELPVVLFGERMGRLIGWARATAGRSN